MRIQGTGLKINLGCGNRWKADWVNLDGGPATWLFWCRRLPGLNQLLPRTTRMYPCDLIRHDMRRLPLPFSDNTGSAIFSGYALEYLTAQETQGLFEDCLRILETGGLIRLCQPDIATIVEAYRRRSAAGPCGDSIENADQFLSMASPQHLQLSVRLFRGGGLRQLFDRPKVEFMLVKAGFSQVRFFARGQGECPDLDVVECAEREFAPFLHVEAKKPEFKTADKE
jgi:hypothetical protein